MEDQQTESGTNKADNMDDVRANDTGRVKTSGSGQAYPDNANESKGAGSPYGGTQSADNQAMDGNQQIITGPTSATSGKTSLPDGSGNEYETQSSYGEKGSNKEGDDNGGTDARGSAIS